MISMMNKKGIIIEVFRFLVFGIFVGAIITASVLINYYGVGQYTDKNWENVTPVTPPGDTTGYNIVFDQHSHTLYSDGDLTVRQNILWHQAMGFNACAISDHNTMDHKDEVLQLQEEFKNTMIVVLAMEYTTDRIHMVFLGLESWNFTTFPIPDEPTDQQMQDAITEAHRQGAVVTVNHIPWSLYEKKMTSHPTRTQLLAWGVDYIEMVNDNSLHENIFDTDSMDWCNESGFGMITGSDMHRPDHMDSGAFHGWTLLNVTNFSVNGLMEQLRAKQTKIIFDPKGIQDPGDHLPWYLEWTRPFDKFGSLFYGIWVNESLDWTAIFNYFWFFTEIFIVFELIRGIGIKLVSKRRNMQS